VSGGGGPPPDEKVLLALCSAVKGFAGEVVETARRLASAQGHPPNAALLPSHLRASYAQLFCGGGAGAGAGGGGAGAGGGGGSARQAPPRPLFRRGF
jgi:hypothetical protein